MKLIPISEIFMGLQGEGRYTGHPAVFVRVSGCTRHCSYCDSSFHRQPIAKLSPEDILAEIKKCGKDLKDYRVVLTGGEPLLFADEMQEIAPQVSYMDIETNGDLIKDSHEDVGFILCLFDYVAISPKNITVAKRMCDFFKEQLAKPPSDCNCDIKVVTDGKKIGMDMVPYATMLMPLTTFDRNESALIRQRVWNLCIKESKIYSGRQHVEVWGPKMRRV